MKTCGKTEGRLSEAAEYYDEVRAMLNESLSLESKAQVLESDETGSLPWILGLESVNGVAAPTCHFGSSPRIVEEELV